MRALYVQNLTCDDGVVVEGRAAHHLINVLRLKKDDEILGLDGMGTSARLKVSSVEKRIIYFQKQAQQKSNPKHQIDLVVGKVKKEALELVLKQSCELGFSKIYIVETGFSQRYKLNDERIEKILISGIEQSNNLYLPEVIEVKMTDLPFEEYDKIIHFSTDIEPLAIVGKKLRRGLIVIGPEGGFTPDEEEFIGDLPNVTKHKLGTNIMRTPTAVSCAMGYCLGQLN